MAELKKIALKGLLLVGLLTGLNLVYQQFGWEHDLKEYSEAGKLLYAAADSAEILYFGESSDFSVADMDVVKKSISGFLAEFYPKRRLRAVDRAATHAGIYDDMLRDLPRNGPLQTVVLTVNMRSFDASWIHSKLETALNKEMVMVQPGPAIWRRFMLSLRNYNLRSEELRNLDVQNAWVHDTLHFPYPFPYVNVKNWDAALASGASLRPDSMPKLDAAQTLMACHYVKNFAFQIDTATNPRIRDLDRIVALAQSRGWHLVLNLLPDNIEQVEQLVGKELAWLMRQNSDILARRYGNLPGVTFVNQFEKLPDLQFRDRDWTNEHYVEEGRRSIARRIAEAMSAIYPGEIQIPKVVVQAGRLFVNDCEGVEAWGQMQTLESEQAHSGQKSSFTLDSKEKFGLTFSYPIEKLDTTALDSLDFSCWVYQQGLQGTDHLAAIAWEAGGDKSGYLWESRSLKTETSKVNEWAPIHFRTVLWPNIRLAEVIKIYPFNPSAIPIWFDDIRIEFIPKSRP